MRVLDLFCGAGGAAMGLKRAFPAAQVVGLDHVKQPHYCGDDFILADAMEFMESYLYGDTLPGRTFDFFWASPPCERYSQCTPPEYRKNHRDLIGPSRAFLLRTGKPFVIENVPSAKKHLREPVMLCGSMFGLGIRRHRFFETSGFQVMTPTCQHKRSPVLITGTHRRTYEPRYKYTVEQCRQASGIDWMTRKELDKAIPPAYSEYIARQWSAAGA